MREAQDIFPIEPRHFDRVAGHLVATRQELEVPFDLIDEVVAAIAHSPSRLSISHPLALIVPNKERLPKCRPNQIVARTPK